MNKELMGMRDQVLCAMSRLREPESKVGVRGSIHVELRDEHGNLKYEGTTHNLVTDVGDNHWAFLAYTNAGQAFTYGMKLGTAATAVTKNGAGSFVAAGDYISGSAAAMVSTYPKVGASANIAQFQCTWGAGTATSSTINRVGLVDNTTNAGEADATHTYAIALMPSGQVNKAAGDTLTLTWTVTFLGA